MYLIAVVGTLLFWVLGLDPALGCVAGLFIWYTAFLSWLLAKGVASWFKDEDEDEDEREEVLA